MNAPAREAAVSVIVPTIGRPGSLERMLESLAAQTVAVREVLVADGSSDESSRQVANDARWSGRGLRVRWLAVRPPNAVRQRLEAIAVSEGTLLLFLDDDVVLEPDCVEQMLRVLCDDAGVAAVFADFNNQSWPMPSRAWRFYLRYVLRMEEGAWQGKVVGPLLRFGYAPVPRDIMPMQWLGTCNTMVRRSAYDAAGGFSNFFLHRCTMNEDLDLGLKVSRVGRIVFCPAARMGHFHAPGGRVSPAVAAEDDLYNRYLVIRRTQRRSAAAAFASVCLFFAVETASNVAGAAWRMRANGLGARLVGRLRALSRIVMLAFRRGKA